MISYESFTLNNGLRVLFHREPSSPMAVVNVLYDVGARDEGLAAGAAHHDATDLGILVVVLEDADEGLPHVEVVVLVFGRCLGLNEGDGQFGLHARFTNFAN